MALIGEEGNMKCEKCGAEIRDGHIYCPSCGHELRIKPDYSLVEEDYLRSLLREEERDAAARAAASAAGGIPRGGASYGGGASRANGGAYAPASGTSGERSGRSDSGASAREGARKPDKKKKRQNRVLVLLSLTVLFLFVVAGAGLMAKHFIDQKNAESYDYQMQMAGQMEGEGDYASALQYYRTALSLRPQDTDVRNAMVELYLKQKDYDSAIVLLTELIGMDASDKDAYGKLIAIYDERGDYDSILSLYDNIQSLSDGAGGGSIYSDVFPLFDDYLVAAPVISPVEGTYDEYQTVTIESLDGDDIYYSVSGGGYSGGGGELDQKTGTRYEEGRGIPLEESGNYRVRAICVNDKGIESGVTEADFEIDVQPPKHAEVNPDGGHIEPAASGDAPTVTITAEDGCSIYYTWDETEPTESSLRYVEPIPIPAGNNTLSVLVVSEKTGLKSGIYRTNFSYFPQ